MEKIVKPVVNLVLLGKGNVGSAWLSLFLQLKQFNKQHVTLNLIAVSNSTRALIEPQGLEQNSINNFRELSRVCDLSQLIEQVSALSLSNTVVVDLTASKLVANHYLDFASLGWHIVSANKLPLTISSERYQRLTEVLAENKSFWGVNATAGAALPIQNSLTELLQAGDKLVSIEGVFSGSLSYLLTRYDGKQSFTDLLKEACDKGFTEPDPREDLSGSDVQRKLLILARLAGQKQNLSDINVAALLPEHLLTGSLSEFWQKKAEIDAYMTDLYLSAQANGKRLAYVAQAQFFNKVVESKVGLVSKEASNAMVQLTPTDNVFILTTELYQTNPLIIRGPGAGAEITATAINIDINKFITQLAVLAENQK